MILYALTIFASAFLLFLVQPIMAKQILPWFGGSAAVWTVCMVFFQFLLLFGYAYSDFTTRKMTPRNQLILHAALLIISLLSLPIIPDVSWKPAGDEDPTWRILGLLTFTIGLPYFLLSTTGPLVQAWFARAHASGTVYRLFALSNFASLLALISYPFAVEPWITTRIQSFGWSAGYALFVVVCICAGAYSLRAHTEAQANPVTQKRDDGPAPTWAHYGMWLLLSAMGSFMLLAVTNHITHDVASVPFLWLLPLTIYLVTFILCFEGRGWYKRAVFLGPLIVVVGALAWFMHEEGGIMDFKIAVPLFSAGLFIMCMFFHGELAAMKPAPRYLTTFFLMVSLGGAIGGVTVGFVAPKYFNTYYEFGIGLVITLLLAATGFTGYHVYHYVYSLSSDTRLMTRNFYGTLRVKEYQRGSDGLASRALVHGVINHGWQYTDPALRREPISYFGPGSGIARALDFYSGRPRRVGIIGLGVGSFTAWGKAGDMFRIYELDPDVVRIAREQFWYLSESPSKIEVVTGDGRLNMERDPPQNFDLISIDAFSSGSIPIHLLTREALRAYRRHLAPGGVIVYNVTNRFVNLAPQLKLVAEAEGMKAILVNDDPSDDKYSGTAYVLVTENGQLIADKRFSDADDIEPIKGLTAWTDSFNNLFKVVR